MDTFLLILGLVLVVIWALGELRSEKLKSQQTPKLKRAIRAADKKSHEEDEKTLAKADARGVIGFLNGLHKNDTRRD